MNAKPVVLIDGHTRQLAPLLIKSPSRLAPLFFLPWLLVIVLNLSLLPGRTTFPRQFSSGKKTADCQGDRFGGPADIYKVVQKGFYRDFFVCLFNDELI